MEHEEEGDARSEAGNRQPRGDVIGDDLPPALIEVRPCPAPHKIIQHSRQDGMRVFSILDSVENEHFDPSRGKLSTSPFSMG